MLLAVGIAAPARGQEPLPLATRVKASDVVVPQGETLGEFRRIIQPFRNWTLICDESLKTQRRVCNLTQSIVTVQGSVVFQWSFAATADGKPLVMMRVPASVGVGQRIELRMGETEDRIVAPTDRCDAIFCSAAITVGNMLKKHMNAGTECAISYQDAQAGPIVFRAPLDGLLDALTRLNNEKMETSVTARPRAR